MKPIPISGLTAGEVRAPLRFYLWAANYQERPCESCADIDRKIRACEHELLVDEKHSARGRVRMPGSSEIFTEKRTQSSHVMMFSILSRSAPVSLQTGNGLSDPAEVSAFERIAQVASYENFEAQRRA